MTVEMEKASTKDSLDTERKRLASLSVSKINNHTNRDTSGESSPDTDEEDEFGDRGRQDQSDLPSEYWQIQKLVKYLKVSPHSMNSYPHLLI